MKVPLFTGCATALVTPFSPEGIDYARLAALIDRQAEGGVSALAVSATTGEAATLSAAEHDELVDFCVRYTAGRMKIIAGIGSNNTRAALDNAEAAARDGADGVLMVTPYYNKTTPEGLVRHFTFVADRSPLPLIVYNVPSRTCVGCTAEVYEALAAHPRINGVKEASGDFSLLSQTLSRCGGELNIWSGNDDHTLAMMAMGAVGVVSVASNLIPGAMSALCAACLDGDLTAARSLQMRWAPLFSSLFWDVNPIPVKTAMLMMGLDSGILRLPLCEMSEPHRSRLALCLKELALTD